MITTDVLDASQLQDAGDHRLLDAAIGALFVHAALIGCIVLQRFCFFIGGAPVFFCLPIFLGLVAWMLAIGRAEFRVTSLALFTLFSVAALISALAAVNSPDQRTGSASMASLIGLMLIYIGLTVRPTARFDGSRALGIFLFYVRICAVLGIAQYFLQFVGFRFFSFFVAFPSLRPILIEPFYNYQPVISYGSSVMRSNGVFLLEPSTFSQLLMLGVIVDFFVRRDWRFLPLYGFAYVLTYAGTGLVALIIACAIMCVVAPQRAGRILLFAGVALFLGFLTAVALPGQFQAIANRAGELDATGSSAYARYMTQFSVLDAVWGELRVLIGYGPGALDRAAFYKEGGGNPALKLFIDYGLLGLTSFIAFLSHALWRRDITIVTLFVLVNYQLGGGNLLFSPLVVLGAILCIWSDRRDDFEKPAGND